MKKPLILLSVYFLFVGVGFASQSFAATVLDDAGNTISVHPRFVREKPIRTVISDHVFKNAIVVKFVQPSSIRLRGGILLDLEDSVDLSDLQALLDVYPGIVITRHFSRPEADLAAEKRRGELTIRRELGDLNLYYMFDLRAVEAIDSGRFIDDLNALPFVELAWALPKPEPAVILNGQGGISSIHAADPVSAGDSVVSSPATDATEETEEMRWSRPYDESRAPGNYEGWQTYLDPAPSGMDAEWAWTLTGGRGSNVRYIDIEQDWNYWHLDLKWRWLKLPSTYTVPSLSCDGNGNCSFPENHGTAVVGVVSSINNGTGTTGIASDADWGLCKSSSYGGGWPNVAGAINTAAANLSAGDIILYEMHSPGPASGEACPCNCSQFEYIAMEYWQDNFDATLAATSAGILVVEAAGNGSMNLDAARYGGLFNRATRDSGAILVAAGNSGDHGPPCWTNYGSRIDLQGYGNNVVTTGYGDLYPGAASLTCTGADTSNCTTNHDELIAGGFAGTSSASPCIVGAAAIMLGVSETKYGRILTPAVVRSTLAINATPQAADAKIIGPLPNLRGCIRPDLLPYYRAGWDFPLVPRGIADGDATVDSVHLPATLPGNAASTRLNAIGINNGVYETGIFTTRFYLDDVFFSYASWGVINPLVQPGFLNTGAHTIRGGRHTMRIHWDYDDSVLEQDDLNNQFARQWVWSPYVLTNQTPVTRPAPPDRDTTSYVYYNCDGFAAQLIGGSNSWWGGVGILPASASDNYDLRLHNDYTGSTAGFGPNVAMSQWSAGLSDFVLANGNTIGSAATRWAGVLQGSNTPASGNVAVEFSEGHSLSKTVANGPWTIGSGRILDVHEIYFGAEDVGLAYDITMATSGTADLGISLYDRSLDYAAKSNYMTNGYADSFFAGGTEKISGVIIPAAGWYAVAIWKFGSNDLPLTGTYTLVFSLTPPNLAPFKPAGWTDAIVPRNIAGCSTADCLVTATLPGNSTSTWFNIEGKNIGLNQATGTFNDQITLDGAYLTGISHPGPISPGAIFWDLDHGAFNVRGGRHTVGVTVDYLNSIPETIETDNTYNRQYVWSPYSLAADFSVTRSAPPDMDSPGYTYFNCDGFAFPIGWWGALAVLPQTATDNYDVRLHGDYLNSQSGFATTIATSNQPAGLTDFVLVNGNQAPGGYGSEWFAGVIQGLATPYSGNVTVNHENEVGSYTAPLIIGPHTIPSNQLVLVYDLYLDATAGQNNYGFILHNDSGNADLGFALYDRAGIYFSRANSLVSADAAGPAANEMFRYSAATGGYYGIVVWKHGSADRTLSVSCRVEIVTVKPFRIDDGSLTVTKAGSNLTLSWQPDCNAIGTSNYALYTGNLDTLQTTGIYDYTVTAPYCNAGTDTTETIGAPPGNAFFLIVPHNSTNEGSYGIDSNGTERPAAALGTQCHIQSAATECVY